MLFRSDFNRYALALMFPGPSHRIHEIIITRKREGAKAAPPTPRPDLARDPSSALPRIAQSPFEIPRPIVTKTLVSNLRSRNFASISITDFDCLELARQLSIMESNVFCAIQAEEILEGGQEGSKPPVNVRAVTSLSTVITGWVAESILNEGDLKRRTTLVKYFIKLADVREQLFPSNAGADIQWCSVAWYCTISLRRVPYLRRWIPQPFPACNIRGWCVSKNFAHCDFMYDFLDPIGCATEAKVAA